jgi:hypothetical protein
MGLNPNARANAAHGLTEPKLGARIPGLECPAFRGSTLLERP